MDDVEYPELGESSAKGRNTAVSRKYCLPNPDIKIIVPMEDNTESKQSKSLKRYRRTDKICINLQEALEVSITGLKLNITKGID